MSACALLRTRWTGRVPQTAICSHSGSWRNFLAPYPGKSRTWRGCLKEVTGWQRCSEKQEETCRAFVSLRHLQTRPQLASRESPSSDVMMQFYVLVKQTSGNQCGHQATLKPGPPGPCPCSQAREGPGTREGALSVVRFWGCAKEREPWRQPAGGVNEVFLQVAGRPPSHM